MKRRSSSGFTDRIHQITEHTRQELMRELKRLEEERARLTTHLDRAVVRIKETLRNLGGARVVTPRITAQAKAKRVRRGPAQLKSEAEAIFKLIKNAGSHGALGSEIRKRHPKVGPSIKDFLQKHGNHRVKTAGVKAQMRYIAA